MPSDGGRCGRGGSGDDNDGDDAFAKYRVVQLNFTPEIEVFDMLLRDIFLFLVWHLSNSINSTCTSGVTSSWTFLNSPRL